MRQGVQSGIVVGASASRLQGPCFVPGTVSNFHRALHNWVKVEILWNELCYFPDLDPTWTLAMDQIAYLCDRDPGFLVTVCKT